MLDPSRLQRGRTYARDGSVGRLTIAPGYVAATVRGSHGRIYHADVARQDARRQRVGAGRRRHRRSRRTRRRAARRRARPGAGRGRGQRRHPPASRIRRPPARLLLSRLGRALQARRGALLPRGHRARPRPVPALPPPGQGSRGAVGAGPRAAARTRIDRGRVAEPRRRRRRGLDGDATRRPARRRVPEIVSTVGVASTAGRRRARHLRRADCRHGSGSSPRRARRSRRTTRPERAWAMLVDGGPSGLGSEESVDLARRVATVVDGRELARHRGARRHPGRPAHRLGRCVAAGGRRRRAGRRRPRLVDRRTRRASRRLASRWSSSATASGQIGLGWDSLRMRSAHLARDRAGRSLVQTPADRARVTRCTCWRARPTTIWSTWSSPARRGLRRGRRRMGFATRDGGDRRRPGCVARPRSSTAGTSATGPTAATCWRSWRGRWRPTSTGPIRSRSRRTTSRPAGRAGQCDHVGGPVRSPVRHGPRHRSSPDDRPALEVLGTFGDLSDAGRSSPTLVRVDPPDLPTLDECVPLDPGARPGAATAVHGSGRDPTPPRRRHVLRGATAAAASRGSGVGSASATTSPSTPSRCSARSTRCRRPRSTPASRSGGRQRSS